MALKDIQNEIIRLQKENDICILAHCYQSPEILEIADYTGDSFALSVYASEVKNKTVIMCGVRFMAETCKILSPEKTVILSNSSAGCPMAEMISLNELKEAKKEQPDKTVVAYVNTTSELKTACDVCVTSSSALKICSQIENDILFIPDKNLGSWIAKQLPEKNIALVNGCCPVHNDITYKDVEQAKASHPGALLLVHPECRAEVVSKADYVGSTTGIMSFARNSESTEFIIGTENSIVTHLQLEMPEKSFYPLSDKCICSGMKATTIEDVLNCCTGSGGEVIELSGEVISGARRCIDKMIELG